MKFTSFLIISATLAMAADRITAPVDANQRVRLTGQVHPAARFAADQGLLAPDTEISYAVVLLRPAPGVETLLAEQQNPSSPDYHRWLTPEQFADRFGLTGNDTAKIAAWLQSQGLQVHDVARGRHWISFSGTAQTMSTALHTQFHRLSVNGQSHFANISDPEIPAALAPVVAGFMGLNDMTPRPAHVRADMAAQSTSGKAHYVVPDDIAAIYDIAPLYKAGIDGTGQSIAVVGQADVSLADVRSFRKRFNLPVKDPKVVVVGPDPGTTDSGSVAEAALDVEWAGAIAPKATVVFVTANSVDTAAIYAVDQNLAPVLSESFGGCEPAAQPGYRAIAQQAAAQGITWVAASGDWGAATCDYTTPNLEASKGYSVSFPASLPEVTAIGGTMFNDANGTFWGSTNGPNLGSALGYIPEVVMNDTSALHSSIASGGGASVLFTKPVWQTGAGVPADQARDLPDIAFPASLSHDPVEAVAFGSVILFGGTSVGTPMFAAVAALLNQSLVANKVLSAPGVGNLNPALYRMAQASSNVFHDVTSGDNRVPCLQGSPNCVDQSLGFSAGAGYDLTTGLGSIDVNNLVTQWNNATASSTTLSANPTAYNLGDKIQLTATVSGSGKAIPTGTVTFISNDNLLGSAPIANGTTSITADSNLIAGGSGKITAEYGGDGVYDASGASVNVTLNVPASGSYVVPSLTPNPVSESYSTWPYTVRLNEKAGVATKLTAFTVNGVNNISAFTSTTIPAHGSISADLAGNNLKVPLDRVFHFAGTDANGKTWTRDLTVTFTGPPASSVAPSMTLTSLPATLQSDPHAVRTCAYSQQLVLQETSGFYHVLEQFTAGSSDISNQIQTIFGTTRLGPFSTLVGNICWPSTSQGQSKNYLLYGVTEVNTVSQASVSTTLAPAAANPAIATATPRIVEMLSDATARSGSGTIDVAFQNGSPQWTASVYPARASQWLTVAPLSGSGSAQLSVQAAGSALSNGVYDATVVISAANALPQTVKVRIVFAVGSSYSVVIDSVTNAAYRSEVGAPGEILKIRGSNLAQGKMSGTLVENALPVSLDGVSVTVNGVTAPLLSISPSELTVQIPYETGAGPAAIGVNNHGQVAPYIFDVNTTAPQLYQTASGFLSPVSTVRQGQSIAAYVTGDGDVLPFLSTGVSPAVGTTLANMPGTGLSLTVQVGSVRAPVKFYGITPGLVGVTQINFTVPASVPAGVQPVIVTVGGVASAPASINVIP